MIANTTVIAGTVDITPDYPLELFGFQDRTDVFERVNDRLEANFVWLAPRSERGVLLVSIDALYGGAIRQGLLQRLGLRPDQLAVLGSHTHSAPGVDPKLDRLGHTDPDYVTRCVDQVFHEIEQAPYRDVSGVAWSGAHTGQLFVNRRRPTFGRGVRVPGVGRVLRAPHPNGPVDSQARSIVIHGEDAPIAILWGASCHPVLQPDQSAVSADFPGEVRANLRSDFGDDLPVLFAQGFSGDTEPNSGTRRPPLQFREFAKYVLAGGVRFVRQTNSAYESWTRELSAAAGVAVAACDRPMAPMDVCAVRVESSSRAPSERTPSLNLIRIARGCSIAAVNAEVMSGRLAGLQAALGDVGFVIPAGCCDEVIGYWPTNLMLIEGGYEASACCFFPPFDWSSGGGPDALWAEMLEGVDGRDGIVAGS